MREYVGHGIGTQLHEEPQVPNYVDRKNENPRLKAGMVLAVEPMVNAGQAGSRGAEGQVDGGDEGRVELGALRALHRGDGERAVGADKAVRRWPEGGGHGGGRAAERDLRGGVGDAAEGSGPPGGRGETEFCPVGSGRRVEVELIASRSDAWQDYEKVIGRQGIAARQGVLI